MRAPPISSSVVISPITISAMRGEPRYIDALPSTMITMSQKLRDVRATCGRRTEQAAHLRHPTRQPDLVVEDASGTAPAGEQVDLIGDARAGRVDQPDDRQLVSQRVLGQSHDLLDRPRTPRAGLDRRIVGHHAHRSAVDATRRRSPPRRRAGRRRTPIAFASSASSTNESGSSSSAEPVAHEQLVLAASFSRPASRLPARARSVAFLICSSLMTLGAAPPLPSVAPHRRPAPWRSLGRHDLAALAHDAWLAPAPAIAPRTGDRRR